MEKERDPVPRAGGQGPTEPLGRAQAAARDRAPPRPPFNFAPSPRCTGAPEAEGAGFADWGVATALAGLGFGGPGGARRTPGTVKAGARQASGTQGWLGWLGVRAALGGAIRISNSLPTPCYKLTPLSDLVLPESHNLRPNFANLSVWIPTLLSPSPALTSALLLFPQPTSITLSFPAFLPLLHPSHLTLSPSLPGFPLSQLSVASSRWPGPDPQRREGIRASGRAGPGCWASGGAGESADVCH